MQEYLYLCHMMFAWYADMFKISNFAVIELIVGDLCSGTQQPHDVLTFISISTFQYLRICSGHQLSLLTSGKLF